MSNDIAVFWSIDGISSVISHINTENIYVKTAPETHEEFSLSWNPSDAETMKTNTAS